MAISNTLKIILRNHFVLSFFCVLGLCQACTTSSKYLKQLEWSTCRDRIVNEARRTSNLGTGYAIDAVLAECGYQPEPETNEQQHKAILLEACETLEYNDFPQAYRVTFDAYDQSGAYIRSIRGECSEIFARSHGYTK
jgi:hypothetical protein